jgi:hypothetical protein
MILGVNLGYHSKKALPIDKWSVFCPSGWSFSFCRWFIHLVNTTRPDGAFLFVVWFIHWKHMIRPFLCIDKQKRKLSANPYMNQRTWNEECVKTKPIVLWRVKISWSISHESNNSHHGCSRGPRGRSPPLKLWGFEELQTFIWTTILNQSHHFYQTKKTWFWVLILSDTVYIVNSMFLSDFNEWIKRRKEKLHPDGQY